MAPSPSPSRSSPSPPRFPNNDAAAFLSESNFYRALGLKGRASDLSIYTERLKQVAAIKTKEVQEKVRVMSKILLDELLEACYHECLLLLPNFSYPLQLVPRPETMLAALMEAGGGGLTVCKETTPNLYYLSKEKK